MEQGNASQPSQEPPQHTPGTWRWKPTLWSDRQWLVPEAVNPSSVGPDYRPILDADPSGGEYFWAINAESPNAKLIEQAPGLLRALKRAVDALRDVLSELAEDLAVYEAQIAAAEGRDAE